MDFDLRSLVTSQIILHLVFGKIVDSMALISIIWLVGVLPLKSLCNLFQTDKLQQLFAKIFRMFLS